MDANCMALNQDKTQILIVSKNKELKKNFEVVLDGKTIKHSQAVKILGTILDKNLSWEQNIEKLLIPSLKN